MLENGSFRDPTRIYRINQAKDQVFKPQNGPCWNLRGQFRSLPCQSISRVPDSPLASVAVPLDTFPYRRFPKEDVFVLKSKTETARLATT
uniref:Cytochrome P450 n=1 Tax=Steinernema glaseri TaxID=37863 RepID=A0A1I7ZE02_9BILA